MARKRRAFAFDMAKKISLGEYANNGERAAAQLLESALPNRYLLLTNFTVPDEHTPVDVDALVLGIAGVFVIEIKDWAGKLRGTNAQKWQHNGTMKSNPFEQAVRNRRILRSYIEKHAKDAYADKRFFLGTNFYSILALVNPQADTSEVKLQLDRWARFAPTLDDLPRVIQNDTAESKHFITYADICGIARVFGAPQDELDAWCANCFNPNRVGAKFCRGCGNALPYSAA